MTGVPFTDGREDGDALLLHRDVAKSVARAWLDDLRARGFWDHEIRAAAKSALDQLD